ncbi:hypothetical protein Gotur_028843 [Gossypium turneri]
MERGFLDKVEDNAAVRICVTQNNLQYLKRYGISGAMRSDRSSIVTMVICPICSTSRWTSIYFELSLSTGILHAVASLSGRLI